METWVEAARHPSCLVLRRTLDCAPHRPRGGLSGKFPWALGAVEWGISLLAPRVPTPKAWFSPVPVCHSGSADRNGRSGEGTVGAQGRGACTGPPSSGAPSPVFVNGDDPTSLLGYQAFMAGKGGTPHGDKGSPPVACRRYPGRRCRAAGIAARWPTGCLVGNSPRGPFRAVLRPIW